MDCRANIFVYDHENLPRQLFWKNPGISYHFSLCTSYHLIGFWFTKTLTNSTLSSLEILHHCRRSIEPCRIWNIQNWPVSNWWKVSDKQKQPLPSPPCLGWNRNREAWDFPNPQYDVDLIDHWRPFRKPGTRTNCNPYQQGKPLGLFKKYYRDAERHEMLGTMVFIIPVMLPGKTGRRLPLVCRSMRTTLSRVWLTVSVHSKWKCIDDSSCCCGMCHYRVPDEIRGPGGKSYDCSIQRL